MQAETLSENNAGQSKAYFTKTDFLFLLFVAFIVACIGWIGYSIWEDEVRSQSTKESGERVAAWMTEKGAKRGEENAFAPCDPKTMNWLDCRNALVAKDGPFANIHNEFEKTNLLFAAECDRNQPATLGAIVMEKGTAKPDGSGFSYSPLPDDEKLEEPVPMRVSVCTRAFSVVHVAELAF